MPTVPFVKQTWTDGVSALSAARMTVIENGIYEVSLAPAARVYHNSTQSITTATQTILAFDGERFDHAAGVASTQHDTVTNNSRLTCRYAGNYQITASVEFASNTTGIRQVALWLNGASQIAAERTVPTTGGFPTLVNVTTLWALAVNDYVEVRIYQDSGGSLNVVPVGSTAPEFMWSRVS